MHIPSDEWATRFGWVKNEDGDRRVLDDTVAIRMLLRRIGTEYVWSQEDAADGGYQIVPGLTRRTLGYYLCARAREPGDENIVGTISASDNYNDAESGMSDEKLLTDDEWATQFGWSVNEGNVSNLLDADDQDIAMLLRRIGVAYVWSQQDRGDGGHEIVAGMTPTANGYYLCNSPRTTPDDEKIVAVIPPIEHDEHEDEHEDED